MGTDIVVWNTLLDGCNKHNRMDLSEQIHAEFEGSGIAPTNFTLGILVKKYSRRQQLDKAFEVVYELPKKHGFEANAQTKTCLINACLSTHALDCGLEVLEDIVSADGPVEHRAYGMLVSALTRVGQTEKA